MKNSKSSLQRKVKMLEKSEMQLVRGGGTDKLVPPR